VAQRRREIGVVALGATRDQVFRIVVGEGLITTSAGVFLGIISALALTRTVSGLLFGVAPTDPLTFASVIVTLTGWRSWPLPSGATRDDRRAD
jgi:ABC-type antimicrobial peptide transport system permease subunit